MLFMIDNYLENNKNSIYSKDFNKIVDMYQTKLFFNTSNLSELKKIWDIQEFRDYYYKNYHKIHLADGTVNFFQKYDQIMASNYSISDDDILCCRKKSVGITKFSTFYKQKKLTFYDVGGQRNERKVIIKF
jgi:hypothetical protein